VEAGRQPILTGAYSSTGKCSSAMTVLAETSAEWFHIGRLCPLLWNEVGDLTVFVLGWELACEQCAKLRADGDLDDRPCARVFAEDVVDRPLDVEERADRAAGQDPVTEVEAAGPKRLQIEGSAPGHLLCVEGGDELVVFVDVGRPPVTHPLQQPGKAGVA